MSAPTGLLASPLLQGLGWALLHSLWQGALVGSVAGALLWATRRGSPTVRVRVLAASLVVMLGWTVSTGASIREVWREHAACWKIAATTPREALPHACWNHGLMPESVLAAELRGVPPEERGPDAMHVAYVRLTPAVGIAALAWLVVVLGLLARVGAGWLRVARLRTRGVEAIDGPLADVLARAAARLGVRAPVALARSPHVDGPAVVGWRRPTILIPPRVLDGMRPDELEAVLVHELEHVRRSDFAANLAQTVVEAVLFHHPAVHWIGRRLAEEREYRCDEAAAGHAPEGVAGSVRTLVAIDGLRGTARRRYALAVTGGSLLQRVRRLAAPDRIDALRGRRLVLATALGLALAVLPFVGTGGPADLGAWAVMEHDLMLRDRAVSGRAAPERAGRANRLDAGNPRPASASASASDPGRPEAGSGAEAEAGELRSVQH